jgi:hypothetical protein
MPCNFYVLDKQFAFKYVERSREASFRKTNQLSFQHKESNLLRRGKKCGLDVFVASVNN